MASGTRVEQLAGECRTFTGYLLGEPPAPDVIAAYERAHEVSSVEVSGLARSLDRALLRVARLGPAWSRAADAYAAVLAPSSVLRRKLALLVAILESRGQSAAVLDTADPGSRAAWIAGAAARAGASLLMLCCAALLVMPLRIWYFLTPSRSA